MINIFIAAKLLLRNPVTVPKILPNWSYQVELKRGVFLVVPVVGPVRVQGMTTQSTLKEMNSRAELSAKYLESKGLTNCFVVPELIDYIRVGGVPSEIKIAIDKRIEVS